MRDSRRAAEFIPPLFDDPDWRLHLEGAAAVLLSPYRESYSRYLWSAIDTGSWVAPQLVVTAYFTDPKFIVQARVRIESGCFVSPPADLDPLSRHSLTGPASVEERSAKNLVSLITMLEHIPSELLWLEGLQKKPETQRLMSLDRDDSGDIVRKYFIAIQAVFGRLGIQLHSPAV